MASHVVAREPVFLLAPARSFSTVTLAMLAGHPDLYGFPEMLLFSAPTVGELLDEASRRPRLPPAWLHSRRSGLLRAVADLREGSQCEAAISRAEAWLADRSSWPPARLMDLLLTLARPRAGVEKSPDTVFTDQALQACLDAFPQARYIHLTRHPVTTQRSMQKHWLPLSQSKPHVVVQAASAWYLGHSRITAALAGLPAAQWMRVRAEDVLREPGVWLPRILDWLGLPAGPDIITGMLRTQDWRFAGTGPSGRLFGGDPKFLYSPALRPVPAPGPVAFDPDWGLLTEMQDRMTTLAARLGY
jgi:Sulfotransferase family